MGQGRWSQGSGVLVLLPVAVALVTAVAALMVSAAMVRVGAEGILRRRGGGRLPSRFVVTPSSAMAVPDAAVTARGVAVAAGVLAAVGVLWRGRVDRRGRASGRGSSGPRVVVPVTVAPLALAPPAMRRGRCGWTTVVRRPRLVMTLPVAAGGAGQVYVHIVAALDLSLGLSL